MEVNTIITGDALDVLRSMPDGSADCCVTSPPYYGLRNYGVERQIGLEKTPEAYVDRLAEVFEQVRRALKPAGTLWLVIGDSYCGAKRNRLPSDSAKPKDLIGIPWMLAFALRAKGWYLRQDIIWHKPNPMPEGVKDRCTKAHEYIFLLSKSQRYYFDADALREPYVKPLNRWAGSDLKATGRSRWSEETGHCAYRDRNMRPNPAGRNRRDVWTIRTAPYVDAHFATYPPELAAACVKAACPTGGVVLDPFMGAGTTAVVARKLGRCYIGVELNPKYVQIARNRILSELGMFG
jgi:DNA modification methylase